MGGLCLQDLRQIWSNFCLVCMVDAAAAPRGSGWLHLWKGACPHSWAAEELWNLRRWAPQSLPVPLPRLSSKSPFQAPRVQKSSTCSQTWRILENQEAVRAVSPLQLSTRRKHANSPLGACDRFALCKYRV